MVRLGFWRVDAPATQRAPRAPHRAPWLIHVLLTTLALTHYARFLLSSRARESGIVDLAGCFCYLFVLCVFRFGLKYGSQ